MPPLNTRKHTTATILSKEAQCTYSRIFAKDIALHDYHQTSDRAFIVVISLESNGLMIPLNCISTP